MLPIHRLLPALLLFSPLVLAQSGNDKATPGASPQTLEQAAAQRAHAAQLREAADARYRSEEIACGKKFLVNDCLKKAKEEHTRATIEARQIDAPARAFEREAERADLRAKKTQHAADNATRETEKKKQAEDFRQEEAAKALEREKKIAAKEEEATQGRKKRAEEKARQAAKQEKRKARNAEREAKKHADDKHKKPKPDVLAP